MRPAPSGWQAWRSPWRASRSPFPTSAKAWPTLGLLLLALLAITAGELFVAASAWGISFQLAPEHRRGEYLALYSLGGQIGWAAGPGGLSALAIGAAPWGWPIVALAFVMAGLATPGLVTWASRDRITKAADTKAQIKTETKAGSGA